MDFIVALVGQLKLSDSVLGALKRSEQEREVEMKLQIATSVIELLFVLK